MGGKVNEGHLCSEDSGRTYLQRVDLNLQLQLLPLEVVERFGSGLSRNLDGTGSLVDEVDGRVG